MQDPKWFYLMQKGIIMSKLLSDKNVDSLR